MSQFDSDDLLDEEPSEEELREATELARALDRGTADAAPEDALGVAALLRHAQDGSELDPERAGALFEQLMRDARPPMSKKKAGLSWLRFIVPAGVFAVAGALVLVFLRPVPDAQAARLPEPPTELLLAQLRAAGGASAEDATAARDQAEQALGHYRSGVYAALEERYRR